MEQSTQQKKFIAIGAILLIILSCYVLFFRTKDSRLTAEEKIYLINKSKGVPSTIESDTVRFTP